MSVDHRLTIRAKSAGDWETGRALAWLERARLMFTAKQYRAKAAEYTGLLKAASLPAETREFRRLEQSYLTLAENEEWMATIAKKYTVRVQTTIAMATPSSRSKGSIRSDGIGRRRNAVDCDPSKDSAALR